MESSVLQCVAVCCSVLQCVAVCCSVFQCVAVCCSVFQCFAVQHSVTHCRSRKDGTRKTRKTRKTARKMVLAMHIAMVNGQSWVEVSFWMRHLKANLCWQFRFWFHSDEILISFWFPSDFHSDDRCESYRCENEWAVVVSLREWAVHQRYPMGWLRLVGSTQLCVSFAKEPYKRDFILQNRPIMWRSLLVVATPYWYSHTLFLTSFLYCHTPMTTCTPNTTPPR